jgi:uncharacterized membrane-anchored protein
MTTTPKRRLARTRARAAEPSTWAGVSVLAGVALPGLMTYLQTGSKTAGLIAILSGLAGGAAVVMPERKADADAEPGS